jgi:hypothetical protein
VEGRRDRWTGPPGLGSVSGSPDPLLGQTSWLSLFGECCSYTFCWIWLLGWGLRSWDDVSHFLGGSRHGRCSRAMARGLEIRVLDSRMSTTYGIYPWDSPPVMGNLMGRSFG